MHNREISFKQTFHPFTWISPMLSKWSQEHVAVTVGLCPYIHYTNAINMIVLMVRMRARTGTDGRVLGVLFL